MHLRSEITNFTPKSEQKGKKGDTKGDMRQLEMTKEDKALMLDILIDGIIHEYNDQPPVEKKYHSRAERIGYEMVTVLNTNGFITNAGIEGQ